MSIQFKKAVKLDAKGRVALVGPAGSGKSFTMLTMARLLAGPEGKIAAIDTEHGSLSKYADTFDFDVIEMASFSPDNFNSALDAAEKGGYAVFCCDSLSHFWMGKDGALEFVDEKSKKYKDNMGGWKEFRPHERAMVDRMIASPCHVICTMRTKTDYQEIEVNGKKKRVKVGLAPVQRDGMEYEFDLVGYMDDENTLIIDKTRCSALNGRALTKPSAKELQPFQDWLKGEKAPDLPAPAQQPAEIQPAPAQPESVLVRGKIANPSQPNDKGIWFDVDGKHIFAPADCDGHLALPKGMALGVEVELEISPEITTKQGKKYHRLLNVLTVVEDDMMITEKDTRVSA